MVELCNTKNFNNLMDSNYLEFSSDLYDHTFCIKKRPPENLINMFSLTNIAPTLS